MFFFFKQKTAYEMRISDWSSDVCSSDLFFHREFTDPMQAMAAMKNLAIAGGLLCLFGYGNTRWSYDALRQRRRDELATHRAQEHATDDELRAARDRKSVG